MENTQEYKVDVNITPEKEITIRTGRAPEPEEPVQFTFQGNIESAGNYFEDRDKRGLIDKGKSHVEIDYRTMTIQLVENEREAKRTIITGKLRKNPDLEAFGIWEKIYQLSEMIQFLRKNRRFFLKKEESDKLIKELSAFSYERKVEGKIENDRKGNVIDNYQQKLKQNVQLEFTLRIPIYEGYPENIFHVEIFPEVTDGGVRFWFESVELLELEKERSEQIIGAEEKRFKDILIMRKI